MASAIEELLRQIRDQSKEQTGKLDKIATSLGGGASTAAAVAGGAFLASSTNNPAERIASSSYGHFGRGARSPVDRQGLASIPDPLNNEDSNPGWIDVGRHLRRQQIIRTLTHRRNIGTSDPAPPPSSWQDINRREKTLTEIKAQAHESFQESARRTESRGGTTPDPNFQFSSSDGGVGGSKGGKSGWDRFMNGPAGNVTKGGIAAFFLAKVASAAFTPGEGGIGDNISQYNRKTSEGLDNYKPDSLTGILGYWNMFGTQAINGIAGLLKGGS